jgi:ubiquinone/menaquinone biosynthesis C-methylase UbiE
VVGTAEQLPWPDRTFDLVISTTSFDHWADQRAGLAECARFLAPGGCLVLADPFSVLLLPTLVADQRDKARIKRRAIQLLTAAGLHSAQWHRIYAVIIRAVTAAK